MNEVVCLLFSSIFGLFLGFIFWMGLWWTVMKSLTLHSYKIGFLVASFIVRLGLVTIGFYWIGRMGWPSLLTCLAGFFLSRLLSIWYIKKRDRHES